MHSTPATPVAALPCALDPRNPDNVQAFLTGLNLAARAVIPQDPVSPAVIERVETHARTPHTGADTPRGAVTLATFDVGGNRTPYQRHRVTLRRGHSGRLHVEIESFLASDAQTPARIEMGPVPRVVRSLAKLGLDPAGLHDMAQLPRIEDWFEYRDDFRAGLQALGLARVLPAIKLEPVPEALRTPAGHGLPIDFVGE